MTDIWDGGGTLLIWMNPDSDGEHSLGRPLSKSWYLMGLGEAAGAMKMRFEEVWSGKNGRWQSDATVIPIGAWSLVAVTYNADATTNDPIIYVNAATVAFTETVGPPTGTRASDSGTDLTIGEFPTQHFDGDLALLRIYNRVLSPAEIAAIYESEKDFFLP